MARRRRKKGILKTTIKVLKIATSATKTVNRIASGGSLKSSSNGKPGKWDMKAKKKRAKKNAAARRRRDRNRERAYSPR